MHHLHISTSISENLSQSNCLNASNLKLVWLTLVRQEHLGERRHSDQEVQHGATVGVVWAVVVRLDGRHGVVLTDTLLVLLLKVLHNTHTHTHRHTHTHTDTHTHRHTHTQTHTHTLVDVFLMETPNTLMKHSYYRPYPVIIHVAIFFLFWLHCDGFA